MTSPPSRRALLGCALFAVLTGAAHATDAARTLVLSSIRPLDLIVRAVSGTAVDARELPGINASPHDFVLRPSELRLIDAASVLFWIGPTLERPLAQLLVRMPQVQQVALLPALGTDPGEDPHLWLDPRQALAMARVIGARLQAQALPGAEGIDGRVKRFESAMREREAATAQEFAGLQSVPFMAMHDGYRHFVNRYGLAQIGALPLAHEHQPGARAVATMRSLARERNAACLLTARGDSTELAATIAAGTGMRIVELDPLARNAPASEQGFDIFLRDFAHALATCLREASRDSGSPQ